MHLDPTEENVRARLRRRIEGPVAMLDLLRLRDVADDLAGVGHRTAAVEDSRILPLVDGRLG